MEPPSTHSLNILNRSGLSCPTESIERAILATLAIEEAPAAEVTVLLTTDEHIRDLNARFRGIDEPTDVLTFPDGSGVSGELAISAPYADRQAKARGVSLESELAFLSIHGTLHLIGLEDETERERAEMVRRMNRAAVAAGQTGDEEWYSLLHKGAGL